MDILRHPFLLSFALLAAVLFVTAGAAAEDAPPAAPAAAPGSTAEAPSLVLEKTTQDYGVVDQDREYSADIGYHNGGKTPIKGLRVKADCGCYSVGLSHTELAPQARGTLTVRFRTHGFRGRASKTVRLLYDDGAPRTVELKLVLNIVGGVLVERIHFGEVLAGTLPTGSVPLLWYDGVGKPFEIQRIEVPGEPVKTRIEPYKPTGPLPFKGWQIHFTFTQPPKRGIYSKKAIVTTNHPTQRRVLIPLTAHVVGKVWIQTSRIYLGLVARGTSKSAAVTVRAFSKDIKLGKVTARARKGVLDVAIEDGFGRMGPVKKLRVTVPADAPAGPLDDVIEVRTEVPGEELVTVEVRGRVFQARKP